VFCASAYITRIEVQQVEGDEAGRERFGMVYVERLPRRDDDVRRRIGLEEIVEFIDQRLAFCCRNSVDAIENVGSRDRGLREYFRRSLLKDQRPQRLVVALE
jgi:hypothetical protein